jgi:pimeloyl-ACP methyl ester carboxylesterase
MSQAAVLASRGHPALAVAYFGLPGLPATLTRIPLEYFATALRWLARQPGVNSDRIIVVGTSRGSEAAQLLGVHYPDLVHSVVALSPSSVANPDPARTSRHGRGTASQCPPCPPTNSGSRFPSTRARSSRSNAFADRCSCSAGTKTSSGRRAHSPTR